jgi:hypothetical protein
MSSYAVRQHFPFGFASVVMYALCSADEVSWNSYCRNRAFNLKLTIVLVSMSCLFYSSLLIVYLLTSGPPAVS